MNHIFTRSLLGFLAFSILFISCKKPEEVVIREDKEDFTIEDQQEIGDHLAIFIERYANDFDPLDRVDNDAVYGYLDKVLSTIVNTTMVETRNDFEWEVTILQDDDRYTAFAIPGGKIYIYTGLLKIISGENELFSILAHELFYVDKGGLIEEMKVEYGSLLLSELEQGTESVGTINIAETVPNFRYSEALVAKADKFVVETICPFQYEARGLKSFIERASSIMDNVEWLQNRPRAEGALGLIENRATACGEEELTFSERYEYHKNLLP